jgi:hypothetical protein
MKKTSMNKLVMIMVLMCSANALAEDITFTEETAAAYLKLMPPVKVLLYCMYADGGSIGASLADASAKEFHIFEDHSIGSGGQYAMSKTNIPLHIREQYKDKPITAGRIFIGEGSPTKNRKITPVEEGKRIKAAVECLAIAWLDREFTREEQIILAIPLQNRNTDSRFLELREKMIPQRGKIETEEEEIKFSNDRMEKQLRFGAARYIAIKLKGLAPPRKKAEPAEPNP